jgi:hypothetical protein
MANRLHRIASRNEASIRGDTRRCLEGALRALGDARRVCLLRSAEPDDRELIDQLIRHVELAYDRVASDYIPSPANLSRGRREFDLNGLETSQAIEEHCLRLAGCLREGCPLLVTEVDEVEDAVRRVTTSRFALR